jgi:hypothetical protein
MGQNAQALFKTPEQVRAERLKQQQAMYASAKSPYESMGMALGNILSTAFGVKDPELERASNFQSIYNSVLAENPDITSSSFYNTLAQQLAAAGLGAEAQYAMQESYKYRKDETAEQRAKAADERESRRVTIQEEQLLLQQIDKDPYGAIERAVKLPEDDPTRAIILAGAGAKIGERATANYLRETQVKEAEAKTRLAEAQLGEVGRGAVSESIATEDGQPLEKRGGKLYTMDGKVYKGKIKRLSGTSNILDQLEGMGGTTPPATSPTGKDNKPDPRNFDPSAATTTSPTSTAPSRSATDKVSPRPPDSFGGTRNPEAATWDRLYGATHNRNGTPK